MTMTRNSRLHIMQKDGGDGIVKVSRVSLNLFALKTETEDLIHRRDILHSKVSKTYILDQINSGMEPVLQ